MTGTGGVVMPSARILFLAIKGRSLIPRKDGTEIRLVDFGSAMLGSVKGVAKNMARTIKGKLEAPNTPAETRGKKALQFSTASLKNTKKEFEPQEVPWEGEETSFAIVGGVRPPKK
jgi:hypothetical protein